MSPSESPFPETTAQTYRPGAHRVTLLAAAFTLPLLFVGGSVTSYGVGMAVPDWPTTFGVNMFLYNFWNEPFGVQVEHSHRLYGAAVGLATVVLSGWLWAFESRRWLKILGSVALAAVIVQGIMGGLRVNQISTSLAMLHGCFAQAFFGLMVALCVFTGRIWTTTQPQADREHFRLWSIVNLALVYGQIVVGAWFRHFKSVHVLYTHIAVALVVLGMAHALSARVRRAGPDAATLRGSALTLAISATLQIVLGLVALVAMLPLGGNPRVPTLWEAMSRTAHQTNGAILFASAVVLAIRAFRGFVPVATGSTVSDSTQRAPRAAEVLA